MQGSVDSCLASLGEHDSDHNPLANAAAQEEDQHVSERNEDERVLIMAPVERMPPPWRLCSTPMGLKYTNLRRCR